jgi:hypothetical protein
MVAESSSQDCILLLDILEIREAVARVFNRKLDELPDNLPMISPGGFDQRAYVPGKVHPLLANGSLVVDTPWGEPRLFSPGSSSILIPQCASRHLREAMIELQEDVDRTFALLSKTVQSSIDMPSTES